MDESGVDKAKRAFSFLFCFVFLIEGQGVGGGGFIVHVSVFSVLHPPNDYSEPESVAPNN